MAQIFFDPIFGHDANSGSHSYPFKTVARVQAAFNTDDEVFGYGGGVVSESLQVSKHGFSIKHYGPSEKIKWTGLVPLATWVPIGDGLYECQHSGLLDTVMVVTIDGAKRAKGRFPAHNDIDGGYVLATADTTRGFLQSYYLSSMPSFVGAEVVIRTSDWTQNRARVDTQAGGMITYTYTEKPDDYHPYPPSNGFGFFFQNDIKCLNKFGDWMYNASSKKVTMYFGSENPNHYNIQASARDRLFHQLYGIKDIVLEDIEFAGCNSNAVEAYGGSGYLANRLVIKQAGRNGFWGSNHSGIQLQNSHIEDICNGGAYLVNCPNATIHNNTLSKIGLDNGAYRNEPNQASGIVASANNTTVTSNILSHIGYNGIRWGGNFSKCNYNEVDGACLFLTDGAAIYTRVDDASTVTGRECRFNKVENIYGYRFGTIYHNTNVHLGHGLYGDDYDNGTEWSDNEVDGATGRGIYMHNVRNVRILRNKINGCGFGMYFQTESSPRTKDVTVQGNIITAQEVGQMLLALHAVGISDLDQWFAKVQDFDNNEYYHPTPSANLFRTQNGSTSSRSFDGWKSYLGLDANSTINTYVPPVDPDPEPEPEPQPVEYLVLKGRIQLV